MGASPAAGLPPTVGVLPAAGVLPTAGVLPAAGAPIVHIHTCSGFSFFRSALDMRVAHSAGCPVILHVHGAAFDAFHAGSSDAAAPDALSLEAVVGPLRRWLIASILARAERVVALSEGWRKKLQEISPKARLVVIENAVPMPDEPSSVVPMWGPSSPESPIRNPQPPVSNPPSAFGIPHSPGPCRLLQMSRMDEWKGIDDLLQACALLGRAGLLTELILAGPPGTAGDAAILEAKIRAHHLSDTARYVGCVEGEEKSRLLRWADVFVQPSHHEGMPLSLLEAIAHGLPVVATRVGAVPEVIEHRCHGLLVPPHRPEQLAQAIRDLATNKVLRQTMSHAARALAATRFSPGRFENDLLRLYASLGGQRSRKVRAGAGRLQIFREMNLVHSNEGQSDSSG